METRRPEAIPADMEEVRQQFEIWRSSHARRSRIPETLWASAVKLVRQFQQRRVEPNSGLGSAIACMTNRWDRFTLFLRQPGVPLDDNICERALKKAILHRKNSLFYKTENGARVGDIFMSFIYTCQLCAANPFEYLTQVHRHSAELSRSSPDWMPWNYRDSVEHTASSQDGPN